MDLELNKKTCRLLFKTEKYAGVDSAEYLIDGKKATVLDFGVKAEIGKGTAEELGIIAAEASMGTLGKVKIEKGALQVNIPKNPAIATLACQLAGWGTEIEGKKKLGSGPARILARKPGKIIDAAGYFETSQEAALVLETDTLPDREACKTILEATKASDLVIAAFREDTLTGLINVLARIVEVGVFRLHNMGYDVKNISSATGYVPMIPLGPEAMFEANDAIIYRGKVALEVKGWPSHLAEEAVSRSSPSYGKAFREIYEEAGGDFYRIDARIFAPAALIAIDIKDGTRYCAGSIK